MKKDSISTDQVIRTRAKITAINKALSFIVNPELRKDLEKEKKSLEMMLDLFKVQEESAKLASDFIRSEKRNIEKRG